MKVSADKVVSVTIELSESEAYDLSSLIYHARDHKMETGCGGYKDWMQQLEELIDDAIGNS